MLIMKHTNLVSDRMMVIILDSTRVCGGGGAKVAVALTEGGRGGQVVDY